MSKLPDPLNPYGFIQGEPGEVDQDMLDQLEEAKQAAEIEQLNTARMIHQVMHEGRGPEFLEWLRSITVEVQLIDINGVYGVGNHSLPLTAEQWALYRDGQNSFYHLIKACIKAAEDGAAASATADAAPNEE